MTDDLRLEHAILGLLEAERELYPSDMTDMMRSCDLTLPVERMSVVLEKLFRERRVARLWHRYMLPHDVDAVRATWLTNIAHYGARLNTNIVGDDGARTAHRLVQYWDGWRLGEAGDILA